MSIVMCCQCGTRRSSHYLVVSEGNQFHMCPKCKCEDYTEETITADTDKLVVVGHSGTWYVINYLSHMGMDYWILESEQHGDEAPCICVGSDGELVCDDIHNGIDDVLYYLENGEYEDDELPVPVSHWVEFMAECGICHEDAIGNMPCDNGLVCDKCHEDGIQSMYKGWLIGKGYEEV